MSNNSILCCWHHFLCGNWPCVKNLWLAIGLENYIRRSRKLPTWGESIVNHESGPMCLFVEGGQHHHKNPPRFKPIAPKNNLTALKRLPQFKKVGIVYKCGLRVGVSEKICPKYITVLPLKENAMWF